VTGFAGSALDECVCVTVVFMRLTTEQVRGLLEEPLRSSDLRSVVENQIHSGGAGITSSSLDQQTGTD